MLRNLLLRLADSRKFQHWASWAGRKSGLANRFVAGETLDEAILVVRNLNRSGIAVTLDLLGEGVVQESEARSAAEAYSRLLSEIALREVDSTISIKLTQLGLDIDADLCRRNLGLILKEAKNHDNFVRIDMESSEHTQKTLELFREQLEIFGPDHVGIVLQAYLYRSHQDVLDLADTGCDIRLCKGAYKESSGVAFPKKRDVDENFKRLLEIMMTSSLFSSIATHDEKMISHAIELIENHDLGPDSYEFQMLFGIRRERQFELQQQGYPVRIYVPFGTKWVPYFMRRLAERPANALFLLRNFLRK